MILFGVFYSGNPKNILSLITDYLRQAILIILFSRQCYISRYLRNALSPHPIEFNLMGLYIIKNAIQQSPSYKATPTKGHPSYQVRIQMKWECKYYLIVHLKKGHPQEGTMVLLFSFVNVSQLVKVVTLSKLIKIINKVECAPG